MIGVLNRLPHVVCEVGTRFAGTAFTELVTVIPGDPARKTERHLVDMVLCQRQESESKDTELIGIVTAYGEKVVGLQG
ncbi:MAG TPA: hypothetical protein VMR62_01685 [Bryobacteraceae bacterium]|jgi:hypothetical protein|nr:hypothetical protein [Bryobacteraceae bacterium]